MNVIERRALYNLLRMNWLQEPTLAVEPWQVEDYRALPLPTLFERLKAFNIQLDRLSFIAYADECDSPEELTEQLVGDRKLQAIQEDQIYLLVFELWRRLMNEKPSLSIVCHELDDQIYLYDHQELENPLILQDTLTHFVQILDENVDEGVPQQQVLQLISHYCANDIETFLYDFIAEQIDEGGESYAYELLESFDAYLSNNKWFKLLRLRLCEHSNNKTAQRIAEEIIEDHLNEQDLDYHLELLTVMIEIGDHAVFRRIIKQTLPLIKQEEEFQDFLAIAIDYFHRLDQEEQESTLKKILEKRSHLAVDQAITKQDPDWTTLFHLFNLKIT